MANEKLRKKFAGKYLAGVCRALSENEAEYKECLIRGEPEAEKMAERWSEGWTKGMREFLGLE